MTVANQYDSGKGLHSSPVRNAFAASYSAAQPQGNKRVRVTREHSRVTLRALTSHSRVLDASRASAKGVNCTACGSEIACESASEIASVSSVTSASEIASSVASASEIASASSVASASKIASASKREQRCEC